MAGTLQFDLVSPERRLASVKASEVQIPGADGDLTAMEGHAPAITTLRPGVLKAVSGEGTKAYAVTGGFAEITASGVSVLAERAIPVEDVTAQLMDDLIAGARAAAAGAGAGAKDAAEKALADFVALKAQTGH
jgi:F-type H+-transporting ATPase subunit epsilon